MKWISDCPILKPGVSVSAFLSLNPVRSLYVLVLSLWASDISALRFAPWPESLQKERSRWLSASNSSKPTHVLFKLWHSSIKKICFFCAHQWLKISLQEAASGDSLKLGNNNKIKERTQKKALCCQQNWIIHVPFPPVVFYAVRKRGKEKSWLAKRPEAEKRGQNTLESLAGVSGIHSAERNSCPLPLVVGSRTFLGRGTDATLSWC